MAKLIISAFADEYSDEITTQAEALNDFGIDFLELRHADGKNVSLMDDNDVKKIKTELSKRNVKVSAIGSPLGKIKLFDDFNAHLETARKIFNIANQLDTKYIRFFSFYIPERSNQVKEEVFERIYKLTRLADDFGVTLCHENEAGIYGESPDSCLEIVKQFNGKVKCVFDMGNFVLDGYQPKEAYELLYDYVQYFHIKDALSAGAIVPAGQGEARIKEILDDYKSRNGSDTFITLEPHLQTFSGLNALVGKAFDNPFKYKDQKSAFTDAVEKLKKLLD